jgi:sulfur carrier protein
MNPTLTIMRSCLGPQVGWTHFHDAPRPKFGGMHTETTKTIQIVVNGRLREVPDGRSLSQILAILEVDPGRVAVELNRTIVSRPAWGQTTVGDGATLEIVQFVGGG